MKRRTLADEIDKLDEQIAELQREKSELYAAYRAQLETKGERKETIKLELAAVKVAIRHRQKLEKDREAVEEKDDLAAAILDEITGTPVATRTRATREAKLPDSSAVEQPTVNRPVGGSSPPQAATSSVVSITPAFRSYTDAELEIPEYLRRRPQAGAQS